MIIACIKYFTVLLRKLKHAWHALKASGLQPVEGCHFSYNLEIHMTYNIQASILAGLLLLGLSSQASAHIEYYDLNQGAQISDLTAAGKALSTTQYGANPVVSGAGVGAGANTSSDRPLNNPTQWTAANQNYTGVGSFSGMAYNAATGEGTATVVVNDVTDFGWGKGTGATLGDTHSVDFFNFRLAQGAIVTLSWNVGDPDAYYDSGFSLYNGVASYQAHDDSIDVQNPKAGVPPVKVQNAFDTGFVADVQGNIAPYRNTSTNSAPYTGQFNALAGWGDGNPAGNWSTLAFNTAVHVLRGSVGTNGYSFNAAETRQTLTIGLPPGNYTVAASGALGAPGSQASFGSTNLAGVLTFSAVPKQSQTIGTIGLTPSSVIVGQTVTASASATPSGLTVSFSSTTPATCTVSGSIVTGIAAGNCIVAANQAGNATYQAAPQQTQGITIGKGNQSITFGTMPNLPIGGVSNISASSTSGLALTYSSTTPTICTVSGSSVTGVAGGTCIIVANQAGGANYNPAPQQTKSININANNQNISFAAQSSLLIGGGLTLSASSSSGLPVSFSTTTPTLCTVSGTQVTGLAAGDCWVVATQAGNGSFLAALPVTQSVVITKNAQSLAFGAAPGVAVGYAASLSATATSQLAVSFSSATPAICAVSGSTVTGIAAGTCIIAANQAGNFRFNAAAQLTQTIVVKSYPQILIFGAAPTITVGKTGIVSVPNSTKLARFFTWRNPVAFSSLTPGVCTVSGNVVTGRSLGACIIAANQAGNLHYADAAQVTQSIIISH